MGVRGRRCRLGLTSLGPKASARRAHLEGLREHLGAGGDFGIDSSWRRTCQELVGRVRQELADPEAAAAAFADLVDVAADDSCSQQLIWERVRTFGAALRAAGRPPGTVAGLLGGVMDDDAHEIAVARHCVAGTEPTGLPAVFNQTAGASQQDRPQIGPMGRFDLLCVGSLSCGWPN